MSQVADYLQRFILGDPMSMPPIRWADLHVMRPESDAVWNLRPMDLRIYGWFLSRDIFLCANAMSKKIAMTVDQDAMVSMIVRERGKMAAPLNGFVIGSAYQDVLSNRS